VRVEEVPAELKDQASEYREKLVEAIADVDDQVAEKFLEGKEISIEELKAALRRAVIGLKFVPVFCGSAYRNKGVQPLLDAVVDFLPSPMDMNYKALDIENEEAEVALSPDPEKPFVGLAFKLEDGRYGQLTYLRIYQGSLN